MNWNARKAKIYFSLQDLQMLLSLREETEGKLQMLLSPRKNGLTSLFKEVRVFKVYRYSTKSLHVRSGQDL